MIEWRRGHGSGERRGWKRGRENGGKERWIKWESGGENRQKR
jgi:hypothetical protein